MNNFTTPLPGHKRHNVAHECPVLRVEIALSIDILYSTLKVHLFKIKPPLAAFYVDKLGKMIESQNWCPTRIEILLSGDLSCQYIFSLPPSPEMISYQSMHRTGNCGCRTLIFDETDLIKTLEDGGNPERRRCMTKMAIPHSRLLVSERGNSLP
jgi:hypothetical protein